MNDMPWDEKTLKIAKIIVAILTATAGAISTITLTLAGVGVDVEVLVIVTTIIDGLAAAVAVFFGIKKDQLIAAQKSEIAALKSENAALSAPKSNDESV